MIQLTLQHDPTQHPPEPSQAGALKGMVHSHQVGSHLDGPGLRLVYWLSGCLMRCVYCHNPDSWKRGNGDPTSVDDLMKLVARYRRALTMGGGGLTLSGGEPLVQAAFCKKVYQRCKALKVHTALDTNGFLGHRLSDEELNNIDLVLLDLKAHTDAQHRAITGVGITPVHAFARRLSEQSRPVWVRFVLVPGVTDPPSEVQGIARFCAELGNVERVDVLPFHQLGRHKWQTLERHYPLEQVAPPTTQRLEEVRRQFRDLGLNCPTSATLP